MKKISIIKFNSIKRKANLHFGKHSTACDKMFDIIRPIIGFEIDENAFVFLQAGDGYVLTWDSNLCVRYTPVDKIIEEYNSSERTLDLDDLLKISI